MDTLERRRLSRRSVTLGGVQKWRARDDVRRGSVGRRPAAVAATDPGQLSAGLMVRVSVSAAVSGRFSAGLTVRVSAAVSGRSEGEHVLVRLRHLLV